MNYSDVYTCPERGKLTLRGSAHRDLEGMVRIERLSFDRPLSHSALQRRQSDGWAYVIEAARGREPVAYLLARRSGRSVVRIERVAVHPAYRRIGLASWLIGAQCGVLRSTDETAVSAKVSVDDTPVQLLLRQMGFYARGLQAGTIRMALTREEWIGSLVIDRLFRGENRVLDLV